jgi:hypothetical protein
LWRARWVFEGWCWEGAVFGAVVRCDCVNRSAAALDLKSRGKG